MMSVRWNIKRFVSLCLCVMMLTAYIPQGAADATPGEAGHVGGIGDVTETIGGADDGKTEQDKKDEENEKSEGTGLPEMSGETDAEKTEQDKKDEENEKSEGTGLPEMSGETDAEKTEQDKKDEETEESEAGDETDETEKSEEAENTEEDEEPEEDADVEEDEIIFTDELMLGIALFAANGTEPECAHLDKELQGQYYDGIAEQEWKDNENGTHSRTANLCEQYYCPNCGEYVSIPIAESVEQTEKHNFDENEVCVVCNAKNTCQHLNKTEDEVRSYKGEWTDAGDDTHVIYVDLYDTWCCPDCQVSKRTLKEENALIKEKHSYYNGKCTVCETENPCKHEGMSVSQYYREIPGESWKNNGDATHSRFADLYEGWYCSICEEGGSKLIAEKVIQTQVHDYSNGKCIYCGKICKHETLQSPQYEQEYRETVKIDDRLHARIFDQKAVQRCSECYSVIKEEIVQAGIQEQAPHSFYEGQCYVCGAEQTCRHESVLTYVKNVADYNLIGEITEDTHQVGYSVVQRTYCANCGELLEEKTLESGLMMTEAHDGWYCRTEKGEICEICGYEKKCAHTHVEAGSRYTRKYEEDIVNISHTEYRHTYEADVYEEQVCLDCGYYLEDKLIGKEKITENHQFHNGICVVCGAMCSHPYVETEQYPAANGFYVPLDENTHKFYGMLYEYDMCLVCGAVVGDMKIVDTHYECVEEHDIYLNSMCDYCGYVLEKAQCKHEHTYSETSYSFNRNYAAISDAEHSFLGDKFEDTFCKDCGVWLYSSVLERNVTSSEEHSYIGNKCWFCEYVKGTITPSPTPTPTPASSGSSSSCSSSSTTATPEPTVTPAKEMVNTLIDVVTAAQAEGENVVIEVVNAEQVLTEEEYDAFEALPVQEQILVTLSAIGMKDVVEAAMKIMNITLSEQGDALMKQVTARLDAATPEEIAEIEAKLAEYFPRKQINVEGIIYEYFVIDIKISVDNKVRVERYGFRFDETLASWIFTRLDLVAAYIEK